jgi:hypothetical protein
LTLENVLWIGGGQGAGKTTVARAIAHRHGLRLYHVDAFTFAHAERAEAGPYPAMRRFSALTMDERWVQPDPPAMVEEFLEYSRERFVMILDDLRGFPLTPGIVADGPQLLPELVAPIAGRDAAVWLIPSDRLQRSLFAERPSAAASLTSNPSRAERNMVERNLLLARTIRTEADSRGFQVVDVDGYGDLVDRVERLLTALARVAHAQGGAERHRLRREENLLIRDQLRRYYASSEAPRDPAEPRYAFSCECSDAGCLDRIEVTVGAFDRLVASGAILAAPGHDETEPDVSVQPARPLG